jgi:hypothetical protein
MSRCPECQAALVKIERMTCPDCHYQRRAYYHERHAVYQEGETHGAGCWQWGPAHYGCALELMRDIQARALRYGQALRDRKVSREWPALSVVEEWLDLLGNRQVVVPSPEDKE